MKLTENNSLFVGKHAIMRDDRMSDVEKSDTHSSTFESSDSQQSEENGALHWLSERRKHIFRKKTLFKRLPVLQWLPKYSTKDVVPDLLAGITVGITVIPQGLAYATLAGLPPQYGLYSAFMGSFVYMLLGSTQSVTIGPSSILCLLAYDAVSEMGPGAAVLMAFLCGCASLLVGLLNFGFLVDFISSPVIGGFTTAAAISTITTQVKSMLGLKFSSGGGFIGTWKAVFENITGTRQWDAIMGFSCIAALLLLRMTQRVKLGEKGKRTIYQRYFNGVCWFMATSRNAIIIILATVIAGCISKPENEENLITLTGDIPSGLPQFQLPPFSLVNGNASYTFTDICSKVGSTFFAIPLIAILESLSVAKSFAKGAKIDANQEMISIGVSNILGSFFGSYPVTGSFSRTTINAGSGVRTPFGGIYTGSLVLLSLTILTPYFYFIPKSALAAIIISAMIFMIDIDLVKKIFRTKKSDLVPMMTTFLVCLFGNMELGIIIGTGINLAMLAYSTARPKIDIEYLDGYLFVTPDRSLIFTCMDYFIPIVKKACVQYPGVPVVLDLQHSSEADFSTANGIKNLADDLDKLGHEVIVSRCEPQVLSVLQSMESKVKFIWDEMELDSLSSVKSDEQTNESITKDALPSPGILQQTDIAFTRIKIPDITVKIQID